MLGWRTYEARSVSLSLQFSGPRQFRCACNDPSVRPGLCSPFIEPLDHCVNYYEGVLLIYVLKFNFVCLEYGKGLIEYPSGGVINHCMHLDGFNNRYYVANLMFKCIYF